MTTHISGVRSRDRTVVRQAAPVTSNSSAAIAVEDLEVIRGTKKVLDRISAVVPYGSITGLLGPSGGGKTTLLRAIVGVQRLSTGTVSVLGVPAGSAVQRRGIGYSSGRSHLAASAMTWLETMIAGARWHVRSSGARGCLCSMSRPPAGIHWCESSCGRSSATLQTAEWLQVGPSWRWSSAPPRVVVVPRDLTSLGRI